MKLPVYRDPNLKVVAISGGPCGGKSTCLAKVRQYFEDRGWVVRVRREIATDLITDDFQPWADWKDPYDFQRLVLEESIARDMLRYRMLQALNTTAPKLLLLDRGAVEGMAYIGRPAFMEIFKELGVTLDNLFSFVDCAVHLTTTAAGAEEFYTLDNNQARKETPEQACELDRKTRESWSGHPHHFVVNNRTRFEEKIQRAINHIARSLGVPESFEKERKFLVYNWSPALLEKQVAVIQILQFYLAQIEPGVERRIRMRTLDGVTNYYYTEKRPTEDPAIRNENERQISLREYEALFADWDLSHKPIVKTRYAMPYGDHLIELDVFTSPNEFVMLEVEVESLDAPLTLPPHFQVTEVTGNQKYYGKNIARGSLDQ